ncbi:MAG TPA: type II secretion system protein [Tepidisphaeraceae bacterium]|nr:type II secretion system protein [Tepidisphaeraceae bacterium]
MTSRTLARSADNRSGSTAFTLVELLVAIGIIVLLVSILLPMVVGIYAKAGRTKVQADLQIIATSIEAYRQDFGDIPRLPTAANGIPLPNTGAATLGKALLGPGGDGLNSSGANDTAYDPPAFNSASAAGYKPGDIVQDSGSSYYVALINMDAGSVKPTSDLTAWQPFNSRDGYDGPGFKARLGAAKVWGPYVDPNKVHNRGTVLIDTYGNEILYFPSRPGRIDVTQSGPSPKPYLDLVPTTVTQTEKLPLYNASDNVEAFRHANETGNDNPLLARMRVMVGDTNFDGYIEQSVDTAINKPFLLWSAGPDGVFGPLDLNIAANSAPATNDDIIAVRRAVPKCDDVTNFQP